MQLVNAMADNYILVKGKLLNAARLQGPLSFISSKGPGLLANLLCMLSISTVCIKLRQFTIPIKTLDVSLLKNHGITKKTNLSAITQIDRLSFNDVIIF